MRKTVVLVLYFSMVLSNVMALPGRFSAECSPSYAINRVYSDIQPLPDMKGLPIGLHFGGAYHFALQESVTLSLGIAFALSSIQWEGPGSLNDCGAYVLRYLWVPCLCRFYTSEVIIDTSIYCKVGLAPSINLSRRPVASSHSASATLSTKRSLGCFIFLGGGVKYDFSFTNSLTVGLSYCWDLPGVMYKKDRSHHSTYFHNNFVCLDLCFLF